MYRMKKEFIYAQLWNGQGEKNYKLNKIIDKKGIKIIKIIT
jgi:hypothetical protein